MSEPLAILILIKAQKYTSIRFLKIVLNLYFKTITINFNINSFATKLFYLLISHPFIHYEPCSGKTRWHSREDLFRIFIPYPLSIFLSCSSLHLLPFFHTHSFLIPFNTEQWKISAVVRSKLGLPRRALYPYYTYF